MYRQTNLELGIEGSGGGHGGDWGRRGHLHLKRLPGMDAGGNRYRHLLTCGAHDWNALPWDAAGRHCDADHLHVFSSGRVVVVEDQISYRFPLRCRPLSLNVRSHTREGRLLYSDFVSDTCAAVCMSPST